MTKTVLILGANGRFGRAAVHAFTAQGWRVRAATRTGNHPSRDGVTAITCDAEDPHAVICAAEGVDVIVHALNPAYEHWAAKLPVLTANVIAAAWAHGATVMIPGNVYSFGAQAQTVLYETATPAPTSRKGQMRVEMERAFEDAAAKGLRTVILRGGDFLERAKSGNWFDAIIAKKAHKGTFTYPGAMDAVHAWAYLPDMARAMAMLADRCQTFPPFTTLGFEGYSLTGSELQAATAQAVGRPLRAKTLPWAMIRLMGLFSPTMRELPEMRYLWDTPHRLDPAPLQAALPHFQATPVAQALHDIFAEEAPVARNTTAGIASSA
jgi:nucleoside-diphosphate-sugar epimerase